MGERSVEGSGSRRAYLWLVAGVAAMVSSVAPSSAHALSPTPAKTYVTNGRVYAVAPTANATYIGGSFTQVGPRTGPGVGIDSNASQYDVGAGGKLSPKSPATVATGDGPKGRVPSIDEAGFQQAAQAAAEGCPISGALKGNVEIGVEATLES
jgi:hypothetical protein